MITIRWTQQEYYFYKGEEQHPVQLHDLSPVDWLAGSLGFCIIKTLEQLMERDQVEPKEYQILVKTKKAEQAPSRIQSFIVDLQLPLHLADSYRKKLVKMAERACTVGNTLQQGADIFINEGEGG